LPKSYSFDSVVRDKVPRLVELAQKCKNYSPPSQPYHEVIEKGILNRRKIGRILDAVRDKRKYWYYDDKPIIKDAYWEEWE
jgi:hypothetical protein